MGCKVRSSYGGSGGIKINNGKQVSCIALSDIASNIFIDKVNVGSEATVLGNLTGSNDSIRRFKHIKDDYYIIIYYSSGFYVRLVKAPINGPVELGTALYVWNLVDGLGNVDICINDESSFLLACDGWGSCSTKYFTVDFSTMTITLVSYISGAFYAYQPHITKISSNRFARNISENYSNKIQIIEIEDGKLVSKVITADGESTTESGLPLFIRENEMVMIKAARSSKRYSSYFYPVSYSNGVITFGTSVYGGVSGDSGAYPYDFVTEVNPTQFDIAITSNSYIWALNVSNNVVTVLGYLSATTDSYRHSSLGREGVLLIGGVSSIRKYDLTSGSPYFKLKETYSLSKATCSGFCYKFLSDDFDVIFRVGSGNNFEQILSYDGNLDVIVPANQEKVFGVSLKEGNIGNIIDCIILDV